MVEKIKELVDKRFSKIVEYVSDTTLMIPYVYTGSMSVSGTVYSKVYIDLVFEVLETEEYWCTGHISYTGYCDDESDIIHIAKRVKTDEDVIELIDTCIHSAAKLINTIDHIEKEINNYERTN